MMADPQDGWSRFYRRALAGQEAPGWSRLLRQIAQRNHSPERAEPAAPTGPKGRFGPAAQPNGVQGPAKHAEEDGTCAAPVAPKAPR